MNCANCGDTDNCWFCKGSGTKRRPMSNCTECGTSTCDDCWTGDADN